MYYLEKKITVSASHHLCLDYESSCGNMHGHNWDIIVFCKSKFLNKNGMVIDFSEIKKIVNQLDHRNINDIIKVNPTAENIAKWITDKILLCYKVSVQETDGNIVIYEKDVSNENI